MSIVILDNYDSFTYNLYQLVQSLTDKPVEVFRNDTLNFTDLLALRPSGVILSPGPGHPENPEDFGICHEVITRFEDLATPVLGVCLGHQGIVHYLGGRVERAPDIVHGKMGQIQPEPDAILFEGLPAPFKAMRYHSLVASERDFPKELRVTARDTHTGLIMGIAHVSKPMFGVQFHPESIGTPNGPEMMRNFLNRC